MKNQHFLVARGSKLGRKLDQKSIRWALRDLGEPQEGHPEDNEAEKNTDGVKHSAPENSVAPFWSKKWPTWAQLTPQDGPQIGQKSIKNRSKNRLKF